MKLLDYETYEDYGKEWFFQVLRFRKFALLDLTFQWDDYGGDELFPMIGFNIGNKSLFGFSIRWKRFYFGCDIIDSAPRDLGWYRRNRDE